MRSRILITGLTAFILALPWISWSAGLSYEESEIQDPGMLQGMVSFSGEIPAPQEFDLKNFPHTKFCQRESNGLGNRVLETVRVTDEGALGDAVVYIQDVKAGKPFDTEPTQVDSVDCVFIVRGGPSTITGVVVPGSEVILLNEDVDPSHPETMSGVPHNPEALEVWGKRNRSMFKALLLEKGEVVHREVKVKKKKSFVFLECGMHNFMQAFFLPVKNPYYSIVDDDGQFSIEGIPPGKYKVIAWHPKLGRIVKKKIQIQANEATTLNFTFTN